MTTLFVYSISIDITFQSLSINQEKINKLIRVVMFFCHRISIRVLTNCLRVLAKKIKTY